MTKQCKTCGRPGHTSFYCPKKRNKPIKRISAKQEEYHEWLEEVARPALIARDGNLCKCCKRPARDGEKLDIDHVDGKGSHPETKQDIRRMQLLCRFPCHRNKTDHIECNHA